MIEEPVLSENFDKYDYYLRSVQSPEEDVLFLRDTYKKITGKSAKTLTEDFCGTFSICCEWVKLASQNRAIGIDLNEEPLNYGKKNILVKLSNEQQKRVRIFNKNVLAKGLPKTDLIAAMNFSYFLFKSRKDLKLYFKGCYHRLNKGGLIFADCFGGSDIGTDVEEETIHDGFSYFWHQKDFNPINNGAHFSIHFKRKGEKKRRDVFTYDWRLWSLQEVREIMQEVGFKKTWIYWEGTDANGDGNGEFLPTEQGEDCAGWIAYVIGLK